jgi:HAD superfamily hydrolase (TIGR01484 family)
MQVLPPGASKGAGVARLLKELGVRPEELMAIGDGENDVEMLQVSLLAFE